MQNQLTITMVAHNLVSLHYPFLEAIYSTAPLRCRYIIGDCESTDDTTAVLSEVAKYVPLEIVNLKWRAETGGTAIGIATQELLQLSPTEHSYQLQACEVLCEDGVQAIQKWFAIKPTMILFQTRHFWGNFKFDGSTSGRAYGCAFRILNKLQTMNHADGYMPLHPPGDVPHEGTIHRYAYCFDNQVKAKAQNHYELYKHNVQTPHDRWQAIEWCKANPNYNGPHPTCVQHLINRTDYDIEYSWEWFKKAIIHV